MVKLDLMLSLDLRQILPPKMPFLVRLKVQILSKILPQSPNFTKFHQKSIFSSRQPVFVTFTSFLSKMKSFGAYLLAACEIKFTDLRLRRTRSSLFSTRGTQARSSVQSACRPHAQPVENLLNSH